MAGEIIRDIKRRFREGSVLARLLYVNVGVFLLVSVCRVVDWLFRLPPGGGAGSWISSLMLPAGWREALSCPWTLLTYMFLHVDIWHLAFNMLCLYGFGMLFLQFFSARHLRGLYLLGGLCGAVFFLLSVAVFPVFREGQGPLLGASAAVLALIAAMGTAQPDYPVRLFLFGQIRMKYIAIGLILISFLSVPSANAGGEIAHLGGAFGGWLFACCLARGRDLTKWLNAPFNLCAQWFFSRRTARKNSPGKGRKGWARNPHMRVHTAREARDWQAPSAAPRPEQGALDGILEKLKRSGYSSLSAEEKRILFEASKRK